jgi:hypothetical protein
VVWKGGRLEEMLLEAAATMHIHHTEKLLSSRASSIMMMIIRELSE